MYQSLQECLTYIYICNTLDIDKFDYNYTFGAKNIYIQVQNVGLYILFIRNEMKPLEALIIKITKAQSPRGHIAHLSNIDQVLTVFGNKDSVSNLCKRLNPKEEVGQPRTLHSVIYQYLYQLIPSHQQLHNKVLQAYSSIFSAFVQTNTKKH